MVVVAGRLAQLELDRETTWVSLDVPRHATPGRARLVVSPTSYGNVDSGWCR